MERKSNPSGSFSKYLDSFFPNTNKRPNSVSCEQSVSSLDPDISNVNSENLDRGLICKKKENSKKFKKPSPSLLASELQSVFTGNVNKYVPTDGDIWGNDFPEDFSEDCIIMETQTEKEENGIPVLSDSELKEERTLTQSNVNKTATASILHRDDYSSEPQTLKTFINPPIKSLPPTYSSQALTTDWLRNQLDKVNKECSALKNALLAKDGESSLLREKLRDSELESHKIKQQWQTASLKEQIKFEEQIKELEKQLNNAKTQILFKSKEAESNLERYLELKTLNVKQPECMLVRKSTSCGFRKFSSRNPSSKVQDTSTHSWSLNPNIDATVNNNRNTMSFKTRVENYEISKFIPKLDIGKELEFFIHPDLFNESELEFNFVILPSTDYYPFNVMYKDVSEMTTDDFSSKGNNLYNIWKVKRESFGEIMSDVIDITSDRPGGSNLEKSSTDGLLDSESLSEAQSIPANRNNSGRSPFPLSSFVSHLEVDKTFELKKDLESESGCLKKMSSDTSLPQKVNGNHPRLLFLGKSRYFTSLREIYLPLIEMCKSISWKNSVINEIFKHITNMTKELYVAICDPSINSYYNTMHLRDDQIIDCCSDVSELNLEYNVFSPKKWREKEIFVDLRRGIALLKVLCDLDVGCMELLLNSGLKKYVSELPVKLSNESKLNNEKLYSCCYKNIKQSSDLMKKESKQKSDQQHAKISQQNKSGIGKIEEEICQKCHLNKLPMVSESKSEKCSNSLFIKPDEVCSWNFNIAPFGSQEKEMADVAENTTELMDQEVFIIFADDCDEMNSSTEVYNHDTLVKIIHNFKDERPNKPKEPSLVDLCKLDNSVNKINTVNNTELITNTEHFDEHLNMLIQESLKSLGKINNNEESNVKITHTKTLNQEDDNICSSIMDCIIQNEQPQWAEAITSRLLPINEKLSTKDIMALRADTCCSEAEKEFLMHAVSAFKRIKSNIKNGSTAEEENAKKRKLSEDDPGNSKKMALHVNYAEDTLIGEDLVGMETEEKSLSENMKSSVNRFSLKKKRDVRPLRKSVKDESVAGSSKEETNLDKVVSIHIVGMMDLNGMKSLTLPGGTSHIYQRNKLRILKSLFPWVWYRILLEMEMEIQKIFNKLTVVEPKEKKKQKTKEMNLLNCDDIMKTDRFHYFSILAHSGGFLILLFEIIREIGRKRYTINFNYLLAVIINLVHTLLKNGNPALVQRHLLFDILQEILYCRPSPIVLLQMNKLLVDVIPLQPFFTSLMCHNANSNHMVIDSNSAFFTRGACFIEVISTLIDHFTDDSNWEIQTYCVRWLSYMYLAEKGTIEEWYSTQKTICRQCQCIVLLTNMAVKLFESASSYYLQCCIENKLNYLLSFQLLEIIQSGVQVLYVMIDFDKHFSENIGNRYGMFLRFLDTVKLIHRNHEQFKEFHSNKDLDILQLLLIKKKVFGDIAKNSNDPDYMNEVVTLFSNKTNWPPKSFKCEKLFLSELSDSGILSD